MATSLWNTTNFGLGLKGVAKNISSMRSSTTPKTAWPNVDADSPLEDRINYVLYNEINPGLAAHGGMVTLVEVLDDSIAVLQFGGGCQGCAAVDITLKHGVETALLEQVPDLTAIKDATDHSDTEHAYYR